MVFFSFNRTWISLSLDTIEISLPILWQCSWGLVPIFMQNIETITHIAWNAGFFIWFSWWKSFPWTQFLKIFGRCIWKSVETASFRRTLSPGDWMNELGFCAAWWGVILVNLSSNFTKITLNRGSFPVCLPHDCPGFQGLLCWVTGWRSLLQA